MNIKYVDENTGRGKKVYWQNTKYLITYRILRLFNSLKMDTGNSDILLLERSLKINHKIKILSGECKSSS